ncbi:MAG: TonB-dependent receptor [Terricaulis sp.]
MTLQGGADAQPLPLPAAQQTDVHHYSIPAQPLHSAIVEFARQSNLQTMFNLDEMSGQTSRPIDGDYSDRDALTRLLPASAPPLSIVEGRIVRTDRPQSNDERETASTEEIVVTGSRIRSAAPTGANLITLNRHDIDATVRSSVQDVIQTLPQNFAGSQNETTQEGTRNALSNVSFASTANLRGLGADATLTLVDGRRLAPVGSGNFVDIAGIPLSAVSRIEVLADGASATYGSDAVGGVVNIILNQNFQGAETTLRYGGATQGGAEDIGISQLAGFQWHGGQLTAGYEYRRRSEVEVSDREATRSADFRERGGDDFRSLYNNPGNIIAVGDADADLAVPRGQDGTSLSEADLISGAALGEFNKGSWLFPRQTTNAVFLSGHQDLSDHLQVYADALASDRRAYSEHTNLSADLIVPESNAYRVLNNLFPGQGDLLIEYDTTADLGPAITDADTTSFSSVAGASYAFDNDWRVDGDITYARSNERVALSNFFDSDNTAPLESGDLATAFNPFADGSNTNPDVLRALTLNQHEHSTGLTTTYNFKADGPLFSLGGGPLRAAFGVERRDERFRVNRIEETGAGDTDIDNQAPGERTVDAIFAELNAPLIGPDNAIPLARSVTFSISARREDASDYGASTTPKLGVRWELVDGFALRGSWGLSFKGPTFKQLLSGVTSSLVRIPGSLDPLAPNATEGLLIVLGSNRELKPERAETWTAGFDFQPSWFEGFRASAAYFDLDFADRVALPGNPFTILVNPAGFESVVFRNPSAALVTSFLALGRVAGSLPPSQVDVILNLRNVNLSSQRVRGVDLSSSYSFQTAIGDLSLDASASILFEHASTLTSGATPVSALDNVNGPLSLRTRLGANWHAGSWNVGASVNFAGSYTDNVSIPNRRIKSDATVDARIAYLIGDADQPGSEISLNVQNLFDRDPPFVNNPTGYAYDPANASLMGRVVSLELRHRW